MKKARFREVVRHPITEFRTQFIYWT